MDEVGRYHSSWVGGSCYSASAALRRRSNPELDLDLELVMDGLLSFLGMSWPVVAQSVRTDTRGCLCPGLGA